MLKSLAMTLFAFICLFFSTNCVSYPISQTNFNQNFTLNDKYLNDDVIFQRINIDGIWWIIVFRDGVKIQEYVDPDQT